MGQEYCHHANSVNMINRVPKWRKPVSLAVRWIVTATLLGLLLRRLDTVGFFNSKDMPLPLAALGLGVFLHSWAFVLGGSRWLLLLRVQGIDCSYREVLVSYYLGIFFNNFLPTGMGGDVVRTIRLRLLGHALQPLIMVAIVDRMIGLSVILVMGTVALPFWNNPYLTGWMAWLPAVFTIVLLLLIGILLRPLELWLAQNEHRVHRHFLRIVFAVTRAICTFYQAKSVLCAAMALTLILQSLVVLIYILLGQKVGIDAPLPIYFVSGLVTFLATSLPISIGGLGVREGALAGLLILAGADTNRAVMLSLLYLVVLWTAALPGGLMFLFGRLNRV